jgi:hypothetical protein
MKIKSLLLLPVLLFICYSLAAQKKSDKPRLQFSSQNYAGILEGGAGTSFQLQTINGVRYKTWFAGAGTGLDYYYQRSIPLFASVSKFFPKAKNALYFNADAGVNFHWKRRDLIEFQYQNPGEYFPSLYWAGGVGYRFASKKRSDGFLINLGYSYKHIVQKNKITQPCLIPPCPTYDERYDYRLRRLSLKMGWMF